jgi:hypothetical protein
LNDVSLKNSVKPFNSAQMNRGLFEKHPEERPNIIATKSGKALQLNGDTWLDLVNVGKFKKSDAFTIGLWVNIPKQLKSGVIFHQGIAGLLYNFRGFHLALENNILQLVMAHTAPYDAIIKYSKADVPRDKWIHLAVTYDGSSKASGFKLFMDGAEMPTVVDQDNLYKDIIISGDPKKQPAIQFGAWDRGKGLMNGKIKDIAVFSRDLSHLEVLQLADTKSFSAVVNKKPADLSVTEKQMINEYYCSSVSSSCKKIKTEIRQLRASINDTVEKIPELMIMQEMPVQRKAYVLDRGQYDTYKEEVHPDMPRSILPMPKSFPRNRLGFAQWLVHPDHPLTARVAVNRYWQMYFGKGIVKSAEDLATRERCHHTRNCLTGSPLTSVNQDGM